MLHRLRGHSSHARVLVLVLGLLATACEDDKGADTGPSCGESNGEVVPIAVDCSFSFAGNQIDVTYESNVATAETAVGGKLIAAGDLTDDEFEGRSFALTIYAEDSSVLSRGLYQMERTHLPCNEFAGDHGFTGLQWVKDPDAGENLQFACFARDPADPPHAWEN